ncbi:hypothetical protein J6590_003647 [Homalodisca vitripennis]|nr:hypothetical protein J6590_003647 [Homalodisca vitripennis]
MVNQETLLNVQQFLGWVIPAAIIAAVMTSWCYYSQWHKEITGYILSIKNEAKQVKFDEALDLIDQGTLCTCASQRSFADVGQESLQPHNPADGGRHDERCATSVMPCHTAVASRPSIYSMNVRVCCDGLESRQTTRHASASAANATSTQWQERAVPGEGVGEVLYAHARAFVASPTSAKDSSSRITQQTVADGTNVALRRLCQCDLSYLTTWLAIILKIHPQMDGRDATAV